MTQKARLPGFPPFRVKAVKHDFFSLRDDARGWLPDTAQPLDAPQKVDSTAFSCRKRMYPTFEVM